MSGKVVAGSNGARTGNNAISTDIPSGSRKMVQSLKEIVNCPDPEIYAALKDCNMDPNEAINRLLSQDPFHEVKSKRDKKKETKETTDSRPRGNNASTRGGRGGSGRYTGRGGATSFNSNESTNFYGRPATKKENGIQAYAGSSSTAVAAGPQPPSYSHPTPSDNKRVPVGLDDGRLSMPSSGHQSAWVASAGQMSMADIVKMGKPQNTSSSVTNHPRQNVDLHSDGAEEFRLQGNQHVPFTEEWPSIEKTVKESDLGPDLSDCQSGRVHQPSNSQINEVQPENGSAETVFRDQVQHNSGSARHLQDDDSGGTSQFDEKVFSNMDSYQTDFRPVKHDEDEEDVPSVAANLQHLSLENHDHEGSDEEERPSLIIPDHLQVYTPECSHLSFGSFGGVGSMPQSSNLGETSEAATAIEHCDTRNTESYVDEHPRSIPEGSMAHLANPTAGSYESSSESLREIMNQENPKAAEDNHYTISSEEQGYAYGNSQQLNTTFDAQQTGSQVQNQSSFSNVMAYKNSIPSTLLGQTVRELDPRYSAFSAGHQSMQNKYGNNASSLSGPSISMPERLRANANSVTQPTQETLPGAGLAAGSILPQQHSMHPYSQSSLQQPHFSNMLNYPLLPQSYPYLPSAFQQAFAGNISNPQSLAALLPLYKNSVSASSLPQSVNVASGYGFGNSNNVPGGNFPNNPPSASSGATLGYEDLLNSQLKDSNHLLSLQQQNQNSPLWHQGPGSRTMSAVPSSNYFNHQAQQQTQPTSGFRQAQQQPSQQHYGSLAGYPGFYQSQSGISLEHQQRNPRDRSIGGSQGQGQHQSQQIWQNSY